MLGYFVLPPAAGRYWWVFAPAESCVFEGCVPAQYLNVSSMGLSTLRMKDI